MSLRKTNKNKITRITLRYRLVPWNAPLDRTFSHARWSGRLNTAIQIATTLKPGPSPWGRGDKTVKSRKGNEIKQIGTEKRIREM